MCGRKTLTKDIHSIIEELAIDEWESPENYSPSYNISPGQRSPIVIKEGQRTVKLMKWGLVPSWSQDKSIGYKMINARSETLTVKPAYQGLISKHRCVVIADGYYEWKRAGKRKIPHYIFSQNNGLLLMAGLWSSRNRPGEEIENTYTVITTDAHTTIRTVHHRMPVILDRETFPLWLDVNNVSVTEALPMLLPYMGNLSIKEVSTMVNSTSHNSPDCIKQVSNRQTLDLF